MQATKITIKETAGEPKMVHFEVNFMKNFDKKESQTNTQNI